jgi:proteasome accessory factor B
LQAIATAQGRATIKWLVEQTAMSDKTVRRDIAVLCNIFPIVETVGEFGRKTFSVDPDQVPRIELRYDESLALFYCRQALLPLAGTFFWKSAESAFEKIQATLSPRVRAHLARMDGRLHRTRPAGNYAKQAEMVDRLHIAIEDCKAAFITYHSSHSSEPVTYDIHPYGLVEHRGSLYLVGHSQQHGEVRHWKMDRLAAVELTRFPFKRPDNFNLQDHLANSVGVFHGHELVRVRVRFAPAAARYVGERRLHASQRVTDGGSGCVVAEWTIARPLVELKSYILSFGAAAEVMEPRDLRKEVQVELQAAAGLYVNANGSASGRKRKKQRT